MNKNKALNTARFQDCGTEEMTQAKINFVDANLDQVKEQMRRSFSPSEYESLIEFAARCYLEGSFMQNQIINFYQGMNSLRLAMGFDSTEAQKQIMDSYRDVYLFQQVMKLEFYEDFFRKRKAGKNRHKLRNSHKKIVTEKWSENTTEFPSAAKAGAHYADWLHNEYGSPGTYEPRTVTKWILEYAKQHSIRLR
ncbi:MAG: hypothetical protein ABTQ25_01150 [Nitrosomonas ureae]